MKNTLTNPFETSKQPWYIAYHVRDRKGGAVVWKRIGRAWPHADLKGLNIQVDVFLLMDGLPFARRLIKTSRLSLRPGRKAQPLNFA